MGSAPPRAGRAAVATCLGGLFVLALLHAWLHASVRPMFQVSDEISYLSGLQSRIYITEQPGSVPYQCAAPPDGVPLPVDPGGKVLFRWGGGLVLKHLCSAGFDSTTVYWLMRLTNGLTLPLLTLIAYALAREVTAEPAVGLGAAALVALQPIAASFAGGITPDGSANLLSGLALWLLTRQVTSRGRWWELLPLALATAGAITIKDTAAFLLPVAAVALTWRLWQQAERRTWMRVALVTSATVFAPLVTLLGLWAAPPNVLSAGPTLTSAPLVTIVGLSLSNVIRQTRSLVESTWMPLGNFGASLLSLPGSVMALAILFYASMVVGLIGLALGRTSQSRSTAGIWALALGLCALQPGVREAVMELPELYQGRWLFPMLPAMAVLAMLGLSTVGVRSSRVLPLQILVLGMTATVGLVIVTGYYFDRFPWDVDSAHLFLRSSSGVPLDLESLTLWGARPAFLQQRTPFFIAGTAWLLSWAIAFVAASRLPRGQEFLT